MRHFTTRKQTTTIRDVLTIECDICGIHYPSQNEFNGVPADDPKSIDKFELNWYRLSTRNPSTLDAIKDAVAENYDVCYVCRPLVMEVVKQLSINIRTQRQCPDSTKS